MPFYNSHMAVVVEELIPAPEPMDVARKLAHLPHLLFLDSAERHAERGRYSYVMADPVQWLSEESNSLDGGRSGVIDLFQRLSFELEKCRANSVEGLPPFQGGYAGLFGYDLNRRLESIPMVASKHYPTSPIALGIYDLVVAFDHVQKRAWVISSGVPESERDRRKRRAKRRLNNVRENLHATVAVALHAVTSERGGLRIDRHPLPGHPSVFSNFTRGDYEAAVGRAIEYVHAGDVFQVNIAQTLSGGIREHPLELYGRLRSTNPAPFSAYFDAGDFQIASASPERFLQMSSDGRVSTKPIKGTRPRGKTPAEDAAFLEDLMTSSKDRAENVMIVDLMRNDLGRVCEYGSVKVPSVCEVESYRDVHHLVSEVVGQLRPGLTAFDLLKAAFPGGSVTGAPKVRAMEIIAELEPTARGPYCGSLGWIGFDGAMDTNILIRTFTAAGGWVQFPVGGGVVADSTPEREYEETLHKAAGLLRALRRGE
jgi:para-aminobenzoate synthetase component 1